MANSIALAAASKAIEKMGVFFCPSCRRYKPLAQKRKHKVNQYRCTDCLTKMKAAREKTN